MFHENANVPATEPGLQTIENSTKSVIDQTNTEKPEINHDGFDGLKELEWMIPSSFYLSRDDRTKQPVLRIRPDRSELYLSLAASEDESTIEDAFNDTKDEHGNTISAESQLEAHNAIVKRLSKNEIERMEDLRLFDQSDWEANSHARNMASNAGQAAVAIVYWKDSLIEQNDKLLKKGVENPEEDSWYMTLESFKQKAIAAYHLYSTLACINADDGQWLLPDTDASGRETTPPPGKTTLRISARNFLRQQANYQLNKMKAQLANKDVTAKHKTLAAQALDRQAARRAELMAKAAAAAQEAKTAKETKTAA